MHTLLKIIAVTLLNSPLYKYLYIIQIYLTLIKLYLRIYLKILNINTSKFNYFDHYSVEQKTFEYNINNKCNNCFHCKVLRDH